MPMKGGIDCIGGSYDLMEDCKLADCPRNFFKFHFLWIKNIKFY
jgi:hypothetical protein